MRGRKPKPAAIRTLHGSKARPYHHEEPVQVPPDADASREVMVPAVPATLVKAERVYWDQFAPLLAGARVLTPADVETLADYCRACVAVVERGRRLRTAFQQRVLDHQTVRMLDSQLRGWVGKKTQLAGELGLTAIARTRVAWSGHHQRPSTTPAPGPGKPPSKLAQLQARAAALRRPVGA